jgi:hypothetical protein
VRTAAALFDGTMTASDATQLVQRFKPAFLLARCGETAPLERELGPIVHDVHRFGCTTVYEVDA